MERALTVRIGGALLMALIFSVASHAQNFIATSPMNFARDLHQATRLLDGRVLVSGGANNSGGATAQAELYDPVTGSWTVTGSNIVSRFSHQATLLNDGRVLVTGGVSSASCTSNATAETYNPATGVWSSTPNLPAGVGIGHVAVRLNDGRVLVAGGGNRCGSVFNTASIFDPTTNTWSATGSMTTPREHFAAIRLPDGRVLAAGGNGSASGFAILNSSEVYDPTTGSWTATGNMVTARNTGCANYVDTFLAVLANGSVLAAGGLTGSCAGTGTPLASAETFLGSVWSSTAQMSTARFDATVTALLDGSVLAVGGVNTTGTNQSSAEVYSASTGSWTFAGTMGVARTGHTATLLADGDVLIAGGDIGVSQTRSATSELFHPASDSTPPVITASLVGTLGNNGWYISDVTVSWSVVDDESAVDGRTGCDSTVIVNDTNGTTLTCTATSAGGTSSQSVTIKRDATAPSISLTSPAQTAYRLNQVLVADYNCSDAGSGVASCAGTVTNGGTINTSSVGPRVFTVNSADYAGNTSTVTREYSVIYDWSGFFQPVDNLPTLNTLKAGQAVPVKFGLNGDQGLNIFATGYPVSQSISCDSSAPVDDIEQTVTAGGSSLSYDPTTNQYNYVWKTNATWKGCRQLILRLADGTEHKANFRFK